MHCPMNAKMYFIVYLNFVGVLKKKNVLLVLLHKFKYSLMHGYGAY